ncbi:MAG: ParB/RepB/Spo0J family partition protein [Oscillospiraceae bacterium]|nr:ParB/RepB/Spo0J family partition protein [Oscillospiraceae bacterium]
MGEYYVSPVYKVIRVPIEKIEANSYNPNKIPPPEMKLLEKSILEDGYTMPIVCYYIEDTDRYEIVDGFHRYMTMKTNPEIAARENNTLPVSVIDKPMTERMASTIRHNRARGAHVIDLMVDIVAQLTEAGLGDDWIMKNIGMDPDELLRLKQISGLASLFTNRKFSKSWKSDASELKPEHMNFENGEEADIPVANNFF